MFACIYRFCFLHNAVSATAQEMANGGTFSTSLNEAPTKPSSVIDDNPNELQEILGIPGIMPPDTSSTSSSKTPPVDCQAMSERHQLREQERVHRVQLSEEHSCSWQVCGEDTYLINHMPPVKSRVRYSVGNCTLSSAHLVTSPAWNMSVMAACRQYYLLCMYILVAIIFGGLKVKDFLAHLYPHAAYTT